MKKIIFLMISFFIAMNTFADKLDITTKAIQWLNIIDAGNYEQSWDQSAPFFQSQITRESWVQSLNQVRKPLGEVTSRQVKSSSEYTKLPGAPDGQYVVITLDTDFAQKSNSIETLTISKVDDNWRAVGYFIK